MKWVLAVRTLLEDSAVHTYIDTCLSSDDPYWRLSVIGLLTAMFKCARRFHLQVRADLDLTNVPTIYGYERRSIIADL